MEQPTLLGVELYSFARLPLGQHPQEIGARWQPGPSENTGCAQSATQQLLPEQLRSLSIIEDGSGGLPGHRRRLGHRNG